MLTFLGGLVGIGFGKILNAILRAHIIRWDPILSLREIIFVLLLSVFIGIITSIIPAKSAASLKPVDVFRMG